MDRNKYDNEIDRVSDEPRKGLYRVCKLCKIKLLSIQRKGNSPQTNLTIIYTDVCTRGKKKEDKCQN